MFVALAIIAVLAFAAGEAWRFLHSDHGQLAAARWLPWGGGARLTQLVGRELHQAMDAAGVPNGGFEELPGWFAQQFQLSRDAIREWDGYLRGHYVCLRDVLPETIQRKDELVKAINKAVSKPKPQDDTWLDSLHLLVDELDQLEPPFAAYDRLRFGGPISRDTCINAVRERFPRRKEVLPP